MMQLTCVLTHHLSARDGSAYYAKRKNLKQQGLSPSKWVYRFINKVLMPTGRALLYRLPSIGQQMYST